MSWTEVFPVLTDEMIEGFDASATPDERAELEEWYGVEQVFNRQEKSHIVSFSLFWKNVRAADPDLPEPTRDRMQNARELGLALRFDPWEHYVAPLIQGVPQLGRQFPDVVFRVHLAKDLEFLIPDLVAVGCEVWWMKSSSIRFAPGGLWRFLPFEESGKRITVAVVDRIGHVPEDILRTEAMAKADLGSWRVPLPTDTRTDGSVCYLPFLGCHSGMRGGWSVRKLLDAFTWHCRRGTMSSSVNFPGGGQRPVEQTRWPDYGFDEWFLTVALYPRVALLGFSPLCPRQRGRCFSLWTSNTSRGRIRTASWCIFRAKVAVSKLRYVLAARVFPVAGAVPQNPSTKFNHCWVHSQRRSQKIFRNRKRILAICGLMFKLTGVNNQNN